MHAPGVEVRPLRQMTGGASFNEVFLDEVRVADAYRLGPVNSGWTVALHTLTSERTSIGSSGAGFNASLDLLEQMLAHFGALDDAVIREQFAKLYADSLSSRWMSRRLSAGLERGEGGSPALSKLALTRDLQSYSDIVTRVLGQCLVADTGEWGTYAWSDYVLGVPGLRIAGGTDEVLRNIVAERTLGLPKGN
jgi:alkylation response protein AidB-like acyl-CoA dehydrogenase